MNLAPQLLWVICAAVLAACVDRPAAPTEAYLIEVRGRLSSDIQQCSKTYHYNPDNIVGLPERALAPGELLWHQCLYEAIRNYETKNPELAPLYGSFIEQDVLLTNGLMQGQITRSERRARVAPLLARIASAEQEQIAKSRTGQENRAQQGRGMYDLFRSFGYGAAGGVRGS